MDPDSIVFGRVARYHGDQLVAGAEQTGLVLEQLRQWQARPELLDTSTVLGLSLIRVDASSAVRYLNHVQLALANEARHRAKTEGYPTSDVDVLHRCLRRSFTRAFSGWSPTLAKNRIVERVDGTYVIDLTGDRPRPQPSEYPVEAGRPEPRRSTPGAGVRIGVVDSKLIPHPWLLGAFETDAADIWAAGEDLSSPATHHATFVSGLLLKQAPGATIVHRAALSEDQDCDNSWSVATKIATLARSGVDVLNLSLGCATDDGQPPLVLVAAVNALGPETLVVAAAGNRGDGSDGVPPAPMYPAAMDGVVAVGAVDGDQLAEFSPNEPWVDAYAPGVNVTSTYGVPQGKAPTLAPWQGTSFSAAIVSGAVAGRAGAGVGAANAWRQVRDEATRQYLGRPVIDEAAPASWPRPPARG